MKVTGYDTFDWENHGYAGGLPADWSPFPSIEPVTLPRAGTHPTFGLSEIGALTFPVTFVILPSNTIMVSQGLEAAWIYFFKRLDPFNTTARQLRILRNDSTVVAIPAMLRILGRIGNRNQNERLVDFVSVEPFFQPLSSSSGTGTF